MKKILALILVLTVVASLAAVSVAALPSPGPEDYYNINVTQTGPGSGKASADTYKVDTNGDGTVTLTASEGDFTEWIIYGDYEIISGDLNSPIIVIRPLSDIDAVAVFAASDTDYYYVTVEPKGKGSASADPGKVLKSDDDEVITLTATETTDGWVFKNWTLTGDYEIISGDVNSKVLVIRPLSDVVAFANFEETTVEEPTSKPEETVKPTTPSDGGKTSPKTADPAFAVLAVLFVALAAGAVVFKKVKG